ncbi:MAG: hypothetical protein WB760_25360 [Xanthobacteraceae bacterium]
MPQRIFRHLRNLWRIEGTIAQARFGLTMRRAVLYALAGLIAVFGLGMLNVAAFFAFQSSLGPVWAAVAAAFGDFVVAAIMVAIALTAKPGPHLNAALEMRQSVLDGIDAEIATLQHPFAWLSRAAHDSFDAALPAILIPLVTAILRGLRRKKAEPQ